MTKEEIDKIFNKAIKRITESFEFHTSMIQAEIEEEFQKLKSKYNGEENETRSS